MHGDRIKLPPEIKEDTLRWMRRIRDASRGIDEMTSKLGQAERCLWGCLMENASAVDFDDRIYKYDAETHELVDIGPNRHRQTSFDNNWDRELRKTARSLDAVSEDK